MPRRPKAVKASASRIQRAIHAPTPVHSANTTPCSSAFPTPLSSAFPSAYPSDDESEAGEKKIVKTIPIRRLTLQDFSKKKRSLATAAGAGAKRESDAPDAPPFPFLDLPSELRVQVYEYYFANHHTAAPGKVADQVVDLQPYHPRRRHCMALLRTCRLVHHEATHHFFSTRSFRIFPVHPGRCIQSRRPLLSRLRPHQRASMTRLELRLGPGFSKPPRGWAVNPQLGLTDCTSVTRLSVLVQLDPSAGFLSGLGIEDGAYEAFSRGLLWDILTDMPWVRTVELDAWMGVEKDCPIMRDLLDVVAKLGRQLAWGPIRGWADGQEGSPKTVPATTFMDSAATAVLAF